MKIYEVKFVQIINPIVENDNKFISPAEPSKYLSGCKVGRIYPVIEQGRDYFKVRANNRSVCLESWACQPSSEDEYKNQDNPILIEEEEDYGFDIYENMFL